MSSDDAVILDLSLREFFISLMEEVRKENKLEIPDISYVYLTEILESHVFAKTAEDKSLEKSVLNDQMISEQYMIALQEEEEGVQSYKLRNVGERALYQVGFFSEALKRKLVGLDLYFQIGSSAYTSLFLKTKSPVFEDMSLKFSDYVDLFMGLSQKVHLQSSNDVLNLFDHLNERGSKKAERDLISLGVLPVKGTKASNQ